MCETNETAFAEITFCQRTFPTYPLKRKNEHSITIYVHKIFECEIRGWIMIKTDTQLNLFL